LEVEEAVVAALSSVVALDQNCYGARSQLTVVVHILEQDGLVYLIRTKYTYID
jgi:hypothetical protein